MNQKLIVFIYFQLKEENDQHLDMTNLENDLSSKEKNQIKNNINEAGGLKIQQYAAKDCIFDFGGSNVKGIASFYEKFGAKNLTYYSHEYNQLPKLINKLKKIKDKLL